MDRDKMPYRKKAEIDIEIVEKVPLVKAIIDGCNGLMVVPIITSGIALICAILEWCKYFWGSIGLGIAATSITITAFFISLYAAYRLGVHRNNKSRDISD